MVTCPSCGHENRPGARFCDSCGAQLEPTEGRKSRKLVTVLFCDVSGSTALGEELDSESLRNVMERYFDVARNVVESHGGTVEKFIGDAVMSIFGVPVVHEDDALRAARAAVQLRDGLSAVNEDLSREFGIELAVRIGINSGEVVTGTGGTLVTGDAVNVAARLEQASGVNQILIGDRTRQLAEGALDLERAEPIDAKGKSEPVVAHRLLSVREDAPAFLRRFDAPFVGRTDELAQLRQVYARAVGDRSCHLFTLLGTAGIGKSRLTEEFLSTLDDPIVLRGRCLAYGQGITYFPLVEIVEKLRGDPESIRILEREPETRRFLNIVSGAIGAAETPVHSREEIFQAVRKLFEALARARPLVLVFDDLHWAEETLLELVEHLADWSRDAPIVVLCVGRPELLDARHGWGGGKLNATTTLLEPLPEGDAGTLVDNLLHGHELADDVRARITATAEGNPLFVEQMLALLSANDGNDDVSVPPTIQSLLATRLEQLPTGERVTAERASVIGKEFWVSPLSELGADVATLPALVRKELVRPHQSATFPNDDAFRFRHLLIRDAAYESMPKELRSELHERFASWLTESRSGFDEIVGFHLEQAYRLREQLGPAGDDARALAERAGERLGAAGRRALERDDLPGGINLLTRATDLLPATSASRRGMLVANGYALWEAGRLEDARASFDAALKAGELARDEAVTARARFGLARIDSSEAGVHDASLLRGVMDTVVRLESLEDDAALAEGWAAAAMFQFWLGHSAEATESFERSIFYARRCGNRRLERQAIGTQTIQEAWGHRSADEGLEWCDELISREGGTMLEAVALEARALYAAWRGNVLESRANVARARTLLRDFGNEMLANASAMVEALTELEAGDPAAAEAAAREAYVGLERLGERGFRSTVGCLLAEALYQQGRFDEAEQFALEGAALATPDDFVSQNRSRAVRAKVLARRDETRSAEALALEAVEIVAKTDCYGDHGEALLHQAEVLRLGGKLAESRAAIEAALVLFERKGATSPASRAQALLAELR
jgi:class 3 adenylate cyclase/tetratricopeptide (TPR) repeat protein